MLRKSTWWTVRWWIACCALLLNALAPSVSHALAAAQGYVPAAVICSAGGRADAQERFHVLADCGYCLSHAGSQALLPPAGLQVDAPDGHAVRAVPFHHAPQPVLALTAAAPRGPPSP